MKTNCFIEKGNFDALREIPNGSIELIYTKLPFNTEPDFVSVD